jgi:acetyl-CoA carboxylase biotin carboxylase subunit
MFKKILIANRGEIALRIIRTCKELDIKTVAVYSTADKDSLHVKFADEAVCIGPPASKDSYLKIPRIIAAAEITNSDAIHPGYGFLSENAEFSRICKEHNIKFIGASAEMIDKMGHKSVAKDTMIKAGVPVVPGSPGIVRTIVEAIQFAEEIKYPVLLKACSGGGGRGMRFVEKSSEMERAFKTCSQEAEAAFNDGDLYLEKFVVNPRHVEIQIMGDRFGNIMHYGERDCSMQRRHQKILEEAPSPIISEELREKMGVVAIRAAKAVNYEGAGTIEFLVDVNGDFYFMEMNTRIQVEHPVTEEITRVDLIEQQILMAAGEPISDKPIKIRGHAIECRINAEDPDHNFRPSAGLITTFHPPGGQSVRLDTHVYSGYRIPSNYDSMIAKLIVSGPDRITAIRRMKRALSEFVIEGIKTTIPYHIQLLEDENFVNSKFDTKYLENHFKYIPTTQN